MAKKIKIPVTAIKKVGACYPGTNFGVDPEEVDDLIKAQKVRLNTAVLTNEKADPKVRAELQRFVEKYDPKASKKVKVEKTEDGEADERVKAIESLPYNKGEKSLVAIAKSVAAKLGVELDDQTKPALVNFLVENFEAFEAEVAE